MFKMAAKTGMLMPARTISLRWAMCRGRADCRAILEGRPHGQAGSRNSRGINNQRLPTHLRSIAVFPRALTATEVTVSLGTALHGLGPLRRPPTLGVDLQLRDCI